MSNFFIDKTDPHIAEILERLRRVNKILHKTETLVQPTLNNERFLTDEELSKILRVSRRTLQATTPLEAVAIVSILLLSVSI